ncbi:MAG: hypothetical protein V4524_01775 [Patescibacteria group bacterium]
MKKILVILLPVLFIASSVHASVTISPLVISQPSDVITFTNTDPGVEAWTGYSSGVYFDSSTNAVFKLAVSCADDEGTIPAGADQCLYSNSTAADDMQGINLNFYDVPDFDIYADICSGGESSGSGCTDVIRNVYGDEVVFLPMVTYSAE